MGNRARIDFYHIDPFETGKRSKPIFQGGYYIHWFSPRHLSVCIPHTLRRGYNYNQLAFGWSSVAADISRFDARERVRKYRGKVGNIYPIGKSCTSDEVAGLDAGHFKVIASADRVDVYVRHSSKCLKWRLIGHYTLTSNNEVLSHVSE
jgi:hypothetical protein